jgi:alpha-aminoadipic semialdehyde synthase
MDPNNLELEQQKVLDHLRNLTHQDEFKNKETEEIQQNKKANSIEEINKISTQKNSLKQIQKIIGIRRENKNKWERRVGLTPSDCKKLLNSGVRIILQPSSLRCFTDKQYADIGVEINEDISSANVIIGVKEVPLDYLMQNKTYLYFSHTIKGQPANMPALRDILQKNIRLIDYECIKEKENPTGKLDRLVAFGRFAGLAGAIDFLQGFGEFLLHKKFISPFMHTGYSYMFPGLEEAMHSVTQVGKLIEKKKLPKELCPFVIGVTSSGRVSKGAQEILKLLPHEIIEADKIHELFTTKKGQVRNDCVYITVIESEHMYSHIEKNNFEKKDFYANPHNYKSVFAEKFVPHLSILLHCMFWDPKFPRILSLEEAHNLSEKKQFRLFGISDITCDLKGSIELLQKFTTIENPFYAIDPLTGVMFDDFDKMTENSIIYHAVDHLPAELPIDASKHFSEKLTGFMKAIVESDYPCDFPNEEESDLSVEIYRACETWNGKLMPRYAYLYKELAKNYPKYKEIAEKQ